MCDTLCLAGPTWGTSGRWFAKNSDRPPGEVQLVRPFPRGSDGSFAFVGAQPTWMWGCEHGVNEHGVAIGNERTYTALDAFSVAEPDALTGMDLVRHGLMRGRTAADALDVLTSQLDAHGQGGRCYEDDAERYFSSFLLCDAHEAWVLETSGRSWAARRVAERAGASISNRITLTRDWDRASADVAAGFDVDAWRDPSSPTGHADRRLDATRAVSGASAGDGPPLDRLVSLLRRHEGVDDGLDPVPPTEIGNDGSGVTVCMHVRGYSVTTSSIVVELAGSGSPIRVWACAGSPCVGVFVPFTAFASGDGPFVPSVLGDESVWRRFAALRDRAESAPDELAGIRAVLDPVEVALWSGERPADADITAAIDDALSTLGV